MSLFHVIGFGWNLVLTLCYWFVSLVFSMNGEVMTTKSLLGDGEQIMMKLLEVIAEVSSKIYYCYPGTRKVGNKWWRKLLIAWLLFWIIVSFSVFWYMNNQAFEKRKETLTSMCDERARMLQDQFNVSMNHVQAMSILISTFHHSRNPSAIDQVKVLIFTISSSSTLYNFYLLYTRTPFLGLNLIRSSLRFLVLNSPNYGFKIKHLWNFQ